MFAWYLKKSTLVCTALACLLLSGCGSSLGFVHAPPASYRVPLPDGIQGVWAREGPDNGERVRVSSLDNGTVRLDFFKTKPSSQPMPEAPLILQALRFDNTDWLLIDMRKLSALEDAQYKGQAPYTLIKYALEDGNRLCGIQLGVSLFAQAIETGQLEGKVDVYAKPFMRATVTSSGEDWVKWWVAQPASEKMFAQPVFCFQRIN